MQKAPKAKRWTGWDVELLSVYVMWASYVFMHVNVTIAGPVCSENKSHVVVCTVYISMQHRIHTSSQKCPKRFELIKVCVHKVDVKCFWFRTRDHFKILETHLAVWASLQNTKGSHSGCRWFYYQNMKVPESHKTPGDCGQYNRVGDSNTVQHNSCNFALSHQRISNWFIIV